MPKQNLCGRDLAGPRFGKIRPKGSGKQQDLGGMEVFPSECQSYYASKDPSQMTEECRDCIYTSYDLARGCPCDLKPSMTPDELCEYAACLEQNKDKQSCFVPYNAMFNVGDIKDDAYTAPLQASELVCKSKFVAKYR